MLVSKNIRRSTVPFWASTIPRNSLRFPSSRVMACLLKAWRADHHHSSTLCNYLACPAALTLTNAFEQKRGSGPSLPVGRHDVLDHALLAGELLVLPQDARIAYFIEWQAEVAA